MQNTWMLMATSIYIHLLVKSVPVCLLRGYCLEIENILKICQVNMLEYMNLLNLSSCKQTKINDSLSNF